MNVAIRSSTAFLLLCGISVHALPISQSDQRASELVPAHASMREAGIGMHASHPAYQNTSINAYGTPMSPEELHQHLRVREKEILMPFWDALETELNARVAQEVHDYDLKYGNRTDDMMVHAEGLFDDQGLFGKHSAFANYRKCADNGEDVNILERIENNPVIKNTKSMIIGVKEKGLITYSKDLLKKIGDEDLKGMLKGQTEAMCDDDEVADAKEMEDAADAVQKFVDLRENGITITKAQAASMANSAAAKTLKSIKKLVSKSSMPTKPKCAVIHLIMPMAEKSLEVVSGFITKELQKAKSETDKFINSNPIKEFTDELTKKAAMAILDHFMTEEELKAIDEKAGRFADSACQKSTKKIIEKADSLTGQICATVDKKLDSTKVKVGDKDASLKAIVKSIISGEAVDVVDKYLMDLMDKFFSMLNEKIWRPLGTKLTARFGVGLQTSTNIIDGVCGLVPEVGAAICAAITVTLNQAMSKLVGPLTLAIVKGFKKMVESSSKRMISGWTQTLGSVISHTYIEAGDRAYGTIQDTLAESGSENGMVKNILWPFLTTLFPVVMPALSKGLGSCYDNSNQILRAVRNARCPQFDEASTTYATQSTTMLLAAPPSLPPMPLELAGAHNRYLALLNVDLKDGLHHTSRQVHNPATRYALSLDATSSHFQIEHHEIELYTPGWSEEPHGSGMFGDHEDDVDLDNDVDLDIHQQGLGEHEEDADDHEENADTVSALRCGWNCMKKRVKDKLKRAKDKLRKAKAKARRIAAALKRKAKEAAKKVSDAIKTKALDAVKSGLMKGLAGSSQDAQDELAGLEKCLDAGGLEKSPPVTELAKTIVKDLFEETTKMGKGLPAYAKSWTQTNVDGFLDKLLSDAKSVFEDEQDPEAGSLIEEIGDRVDESAADKALEVVDAAQEKIRKLLKAMGTQMTKSSSIDPKMGCIVVYVMTMSVEYALPDASEVVEMAMEELNNMWESFKNSKMVTNLMDRVSAMSGMDDVKEFVEQADEKAAAIVRSKCNKVKDDLLSMADGDFEMTEAIFCRVVQFQRSDLVTNAIEGVEKAVDIVKRIDEGTMSEVAEEMVEETMAKMLQVLDDKLLAKLEARVTADTLARIDILLETLLGVCGLIPFVGAGICASLTVMLQQALPITVAPLASKFVGYIKELIYDKVTGEMKTAVGDVVRKFEGQAAVAQAEVKSKVESALDETAAGSVFKYLPIVWTFAKSLYPVMFDSLISEINTCKETYLDLGTLLCFTPPSPPALPPPPPNFGHMYEYSTPDDGSTLGAVFGPEPAIKIEGCAIKSRAQDALLGGSVFYHGHKLEDGSYDNMMHYDGIGLHSCIAKDETNGDLIIAAFSIGSREANITVAGDHVELGHQMVFNPQDEDGNVISEGHEAPQPFPETATVMGKVAAADYQDELKIGLFGVPITPETNKLAYMAYQQMQTGGNALKDAPFFRLEFVRFALLNDLEHQVPHSKDGELVPLSEVGRMRVSPPAPPVDSSMAGCSPGDDTSSYMNDNYLDPTILEFVSSFTFGNDDRSGAEILNFGNDGGIKVNSCDESSNAVSQMHLGALSQSGPINCRGGETKGCLGNCNRITGGKKRSQSSAAWQLCETGPLGRKSGYFSAELEVPAIKNDLFGEQKPNKKLNVTIMKYPTGLGYDNYYNLYLMLNLGSIRPAYILTKLVKLACGPNSGDRAGCDTSKWNADWLPTFDQTKIILAKGFAWGIKPPFVPSVTQAPDMYALETQFSATDDTWVLPDGTWVPMGAFTEFKDLTSDGMYILATVTFKPETTVGKVLSFPAKLAGKEIGPEEFTKSSELFFPIFGSPAEILAGTSYKITTPGSCLGKLSPQIEGQEAMLFPKDTSVLSLPQTNCYAKGFIVQFDERYIQLDGFGGSAGVESVQFKMTNAIIAFPVFEKGTKGPVYWDVKGTTDIIGEYKNSDTLGKSVQLGAVLQTHWQLGKMKFTHLSLSLNYRWKAPVAPLNGFTTQLAAITSSETKKSDGTNVTIGITVGFQMPLGIDMFRVAGWISKFGFIFTIKSMSLSDLVQFMNSNAEEGAAPGSALAGFYKALESISIEDLEICAAPYSSVRIFTPDHPDDGYECAQGMQATVSIKIFMLEAKFDYEKNMEDKTMSYKIEIINIADALSALVGAIKRKITDGIDSQFAGLMKVIEKFFAGFGLQSFLFEAGVVEKKFAFNAEFDVKIPSVDWFGSSAEHMVASEAVHEADKEKSISLPISAAFDSFFSLIKSWGSSVIARALDIFGLPPYGDGHVCFKDKHCSSNNCHLGICKSCSKHKTKAGCHMSNNIANGPTGCQWWSKKDNCNTNVRNKFRRTTCNYNGCKWPETSKGKPVKKRDGGYCKGTWHGALSKGKCIPRKCDKAAVCTSGKECTYANVCDGKELNPAYPSGRIPTTASLMSLIEYEPKDEYGVRPRGWKYEPNDGPRLGRIKLRSMQRPHGEGGIRPGFIANATHRESMWALAAAKHQAFLADHAASLDDKIKSLELAHGGWKDSLNSINVTQQMDDHYKMLHPHETMQLLLHEIQSNVYPEVDEVDEMGLATDASEAAFDASMRSLSSLYDKMGVQNTAKDDLMPHTPLNAGEWYTNHTGTVMAHLLGEMRARKANLQAKLA